MRDGSTTRLLMTVDAVGGVWQYATDLAQSLAGHGFETLLAVLGPEPDEGQREAVRGMAGVRVIETGLALDWLAGAEETRAAAGALSALVEREQVDLVHLNSPALAADGRFAVPVLGAVHGCMSTWWQAARPGQPLDPDLAWHHAMMREGMRRCDAVVAPSAAYAETVWQHYGLPLRPFVVHNGRRRPALAPQGKPEPIAFTAGRLWDEVKATPLLDAVAARLSVPFEAAGPLQAPHGEAVRPQHLLATGTLDGTALSARMAKRPVFVSAATFEPFGLAVLEAASHGCALVLSDIPTFRELWDGAASFVPCGDVDGFAAAIEALLADPARRERLGEAARMRAQEFTPQATAAAMADHYRALIAAPRPDSLPVREVAA